MKHTIHSVYRTFLLVLVGILFLGFSSARANTILLNFLLDNINSDFIGGSAIGQDTTTGHTLSNAWWNNIIVAQPPSTSLVDSTDTSTGITLTLSGSFTGNRSNANAGYSGSNPALTGVYPAASYLDEFFLNAASSGTITLSGLNPSTTYNFTFLSARGNGQTAAGRIGDFTFSGANTVQVLGVDAITSDGFGNSTLQHANGVVPTAGGTITILDSSANATQSFGGYLNFLQVDSVPEPSSVALLMLGGLGLWVMVIRRRQLARI